MPSMVLGYVAGSGFTPILSGGNPWSGLGAYHPVGGIQLIADRNNSGVVYVSLSGGNVYSGQYGTLVTSGGPTITSGTPLTAALMDGFPMAPGGAYFVPKAALPLSGVCNVCVGCELAGSGQARVFWECF